MITHRVVMQTPLRKRRHAYVKETGTYTHDSKIWIYRDNRLYSGYEDIQEFQKEIRNSIIQVLKHSMSQLTEL